MVLREEKALSVVGHLPAILAWHAVLFEAFPDGALSRDEAMKVTHDEALERLPGERRASGRAAFDAFCEAFNASFKYLENLYECNENPYVNMKMGGDIPIIFSLPSRHSQGAQSAEGMCTVALADMLAERHNDVLAKVVQSQRHADGGRDEGTAGLLDLAEVPPTTHLTSSELLRLWLCVYDRDAHMMPLLYRCVDQPLGLGEGRNLSYDMEQVASGLEALLLSGKQPVNLHMRLYQYRGEVLRSGQLSRLETKVPQIDLPEAMLETIRGELVTVHASRQLLGLLETSVSFLASGGAADPDMELGAFVTKVLLIDKDKWVSMSTPTARSPTMRLGNLKSLYLCVRDALSDEDPLEKVLGRYRDELPAQGLAEAERAFRAGVLDVRGTVAQLRAVLIEQLSEGAQLSADMPLHTPEQEGFLDYHFLYSAEPVRGYFEAFPASLQLRHAFALHGRWADMLEGRGRPDPVAAEAAAGRARPAAETPKKMSLFRRARPASARGQA